MEELYQWNYPVEFERPNKNKIASKMNLLVFMLKNIKFHKQLGQFFLNWRKKEGWVCQMFNVCCRREKLILYKSLEN